MASMSGPMWLAIWNFSVVAVCDIFLKECWNPCGQFGDRRPYNPLQSTILKTIVASGYHPPQPLFVP